SAPHASDEPEQLRIRGVVLVRVGGAHTAASTEAAAARPPSPRPEHQAIQTALAEPRPWPLREVLRILRAEGLGSPALVASALLVVVGGAICEAFLFRGLLDASSWLRLPEQGLWAGGLLVAFAAGLLGIDLLLVALERRAGRHLEARLHVAFLDKIPRL